MSNFAKKHRRKKRTPVTTPAHIVENGVAHYGTFSEPFQDLNLLDCKKTFLYEDAVVHQTHAPYRVGSV
ncbi:MAG: hypothetical protein L6V85_01365 [Clostridiales bacterium]|nr:MAG: hypothetical protein L6V85_01365 [Clostridiales bacterium]